MIYSTNRTASIGDVAVDVNESYFGEGSMYFMQEAAQDELALFEMAIKTDIDEVLIGESASELEALNESFVEKTVNKIKELMRKFIEWLKGITRSALAKLNQFIVRDNAQFCKNARKMIAKMKNKDFKADGKVLKSFDFGPNAINTEKVVALESSIGSLKSIEDAKSVVESLSKDLEDEIEGLNDKFFEEREYTLKDVTEHISFLESMSKANIKKIKQTADKFEKKAKDVVKKAEKAEREYKGDDEDKKNELAVNAYLAAEYKSLGQKVVKTLLSHMKKMIKVARAVVTRAAGNRKVEEGVEYSPEFIEALIESDNYELDELLEERCVAKESDCDDDIEDEE